MYLKQTWANGATGGTPLNATRLQYIEDGLQAAAAQADNGVTLATAAYSATNPPPYPVTLVAGRSGSVVLTAADIGGGTFPDTSYRVTSLGIGMAPARLLDMTATGGDAVKLTGGNYRVSNGYYIADAGFGLLLDLTSGNQGYITSSGTQVKLRGGTGGTVIRNNADTVSNFILGDNGDLSLLGVGSLIELGRSDGIASTPFIDFHSGVTVTDYDVRLLSSGGNGSAGNGSLYIYAGDLTLDIAAAGTRRFRFVSDTSKAYLQTDKPLVFSAYSSGTARQIFDTAGDISSHGTFAGFSMYERTTDTNFFTWYNSGTALRLYSSATGFNKFTIDSNGNILGDAANAIAIGWINDPALTGTALQTNPAGTNGGALVAVGRSSGNNVLIVRGASGQTAPLQLWQTNTGTVLTELLANGSIVLHGANNGLQINSRDNDAQNFVWYVTGNIARLFSGTATADRLTVDGNGFLTITGGLSINPSTQTTAPTGGAAGALPANPVGYMSVTIGGTIRKIPYYS